MKNTMKDYVISFARFMEGRNEPVDWEIVQIQAPSYEIAKKWAENYSKKLNMPEIEIEECTIDDVE